jgi:vancomycin permeability regulator SanA
MLNMRMRKPFRVALIVVVCLTVFCFVAAGVIVAVGVHDNLHPCDVAVVLGNAVDRDGAPSSGLRARLEKSLQLYRAGYFPRIIVSGGVGRTGYNEAAVMAQYLRANGVPDADIIVDDIGINTFSTGRNAKRIMSENNMRSVMIITQYYHIPRTRYVFWRFGIEPAYYAHANLFEIHDGFAVPREALAFAVYLLRSYN